LRSYNIDENKASETKTSALPIKTAQTDIKALN